MSHLLLTCHYIVQTDIPYTQGSWQKRPVRFVVPSPSNTGVRSAKLAGKALLIIRFYLLLIQVAVP